MHPSLPAPPGAALTAPWGIFQLLLLVTFVAHLLVMNVVLGGTLLALFAPGRQRHVARFFAGRLPTSVAITVNLGVPPLLFASVLYGTSMYTGAILSAVTWVSLFLVVMLAYALLYLYQPRAASPASALVALPAAVLLLAASLILVNVSTLSVRPEAWGAYFARPDGTVLNLGDPTFWPRWLHFVAASLAVAGLYAALAGRKAAGLGDAEAAWRVRFGLACFTRATVVQLVIGLWFLVSLPTAVRATFLGGNLLATFLLALGVVLAVGSLVQGRRGAVVRTVLLALGTVGVMAGLREMARRAYLAPLGLPETLPVVSQSGPFSAFLISFAAVAVVTGVLVIVYRRAAARG